MKYLLWAVLLYIGWRWYLASRERAGQDGESRQEEAPDAPRPAARESDSPAEKMVGCAHCGIHLPLSDALAGSADRYYCSEAHRALHTTS